MTDGLSDRQRAILTHRAEGLSGPQIAQLLHIAIGTLAYHEQVIVTRLGARNITHAILLGCQAGLLDGRPRRHGDHAGYAAHASRGEQPCDACKTGERTYRNEQRNRIKGNA